jgi:hypothetical protein
MESVFMLRSMQGVQFDAKESVVISRSMQGLQVDGVCFYAEEYAGGAV